VREASPKTKTGIAAYEVAKALADEISVFDIALGDANQHGRWRRAPPGAIWQTNIASATRHRMRCSDC